HRRHHAPMRTTRTPPRPTPRRILHLARRRPRVTTPPHTPPQAPARHHTVPVPFHTKVEDSSDDNACQLHLPTLSNRSTAGMARRDRFCQIRRWGTYLNVLPIYF